MDILRSGKPGGLTAGTDKALYQALAVDDLPAAWLWVRPLLERADFERLSAATAFNCGLCLYRLEEYERALDCLRRAEQQLNTLPDLDVRDRELFFRAVRADGQVSLRPLNPEADKGMERYFLIRTRWLTVLCLLRLERTQEAAPVIRFLEKYQITFADDKL